MTGAQQDLLVRSLVATADDARQRAAWRTGMQPVPPRVEWREEAPVLPPAIIDRPQAPRSGMWKTLAAGAAITTGAIGIGSGAAYLANMVGKPATPTPTAQPSADVVQWLGEHGYAEPPE